MEETKNESVTHVHKYLLDKCDEYQKENTIYLEFISELNSHWFFGLILSKKIHKTFTKIIDLYETGKY